MRTTGGAIGLFLLLHVGCGTPQEPVGSAPASFRLDISGAWTGTFTGAAYWHIGHHPTRGELFLVDTEGDGDVSLTWERGGLPAVGSYRVNLRGSETVYLHHKSAARSFAADSGTVRIIRWESDSVATGSLDLGAFQFCPVPGRETACDRPGATLPAAERIRVTGTFRIYRTGWILSFR